MAVRNEREAYGWTQHDLAERSGLHNQQLLEWKMVLTQAWIPFQRLRMRLANH